MVEDQRQTMVTGERVTQQFYHAFKGQRATFLAHIQYFNNTTPTTQCEQYASLLLHRLMFLYFLQKKGFLDGNPDYLRQALHQTQRQLGPDRFHTCFLLRLLHEGLNTAIRTHEMTQLLGRIPYLGDGFCTQHSIEQTAPIVLVPDQAFATLFAFFDTYSWRLDEQPFPHEQVVTPALAGAIFEQYNNQSHTGAYYTQSDITTYIANNTLIPALFDAVARVCPMSFAPQAASWQLLQDHPDHYISIALRNEQSHPGETAREYSQRRMAYLTLKQQICTGQVTTVDDLITYNLDISRFAQDVIRDGVPITVVSVCYEQLQRMTILDPTCGSGAFLLAALQVLVPLYEVCCDRLGIQTDQPAQRQLAIHR
ncbi:MAG TPA: hypothetical protein VKX46_23095, partial [Ktedonobacteraceae bacterium]|nr:hypothetical protein [Ktedonobacteraceae bacterium]